MWCCVSLWFSLLHSLVSAGAYFLFFSKRESLATISATLTGHFSERDAREWWSGEARDTSKKKKKDAQTQILVKMG